MEADRERVIELTVAVQRLTEEVSRLNSRFEDMSEKKVIPLNVDQAVLAERVERLQRTVYTAVVIVATETLALVGGLFVWMVKSN